MSDTYQISEEDKLELVIHAARNMCAKDHSVEWFECEVKEVKKNDRYEPNYPTYYRWVADHPEYKTTGERIGKYNHEAHATHMVTFQYNQGHRALYGVSIEGEYCALWITSQ